MKLKKKGFTLLELMIVIGIIIGILAITMRFSTSRIDELKEQTNKEDFKNAYDQILLGNMSSNYHNTTRYETLSMNFLSGSHGFNYIIDENTPNKIEEIGFESSDITINKITADNIDKEQIKIILTPYKMGCKIVDDNDENKVYSTTTIQTKIKKSDYCFIIQEGMCKLENKTCK